MRTCTILHGGVMIEKREQGPGAGMEGSSPFASSLDDLLSTIRRPPEHLPYMYQEDLKTIYAYLLHLAFYFAKSTHDPVFHPLYYDRILTDFFRFHDLVSEWNSYIELYEKGAHPDLESPGIFIEKMYQELRTFSVFRVHGDPYHRLKINHEEILFTFTDFIVFIVVSGILVGMSQLSEVHAGLVGLIFLFLFILFGWKNYILRRNKRNERDFPSFKNDLNDRDFRL